MTEDEFHDAAALAALTGMLANSNSVNNGKLAQGAWRMADQMVEERAKRESLQFTAREALRRNGTQDKERQP